MGFRDHIEPEASVDNGTDMEVLVCSIAISLKRIADAIPTGDNAQTLFNWMDNAVYQWGHSLGQAFERGRR